jgi:hypothetical protein
MRVLSKVSAKVDEWWLVLNRIDGSALIIVAGWC